MIHLILFTIFIGLNLHATSEDTFLTDSRKGAIKFSCDSIPPLNQKIRAFVESNINKKLGRGECWDLASIALNTNQAKWNGRYTYGIKVDPQNECIFPGDILQFENVVIQSEQPGGYLREEMPHHTAIIYEVKKPGEFVIAHQNYGGKRKVILTTLTMDNVIRGLVKVYRPSLI